MSEQIMRISHTILCLGLILSGCGATPAPTKADLGEVAIRPKDAKAIEQRVGRANALSKAAVSRFEASMAASAHITSAKISLAATKGADVAAERNEVARTVYLLTKDQFKGTTEAESYVVRIIEPAVSPVMSDMAKGSNQRLTHLEAEQRKISLDLAADLLTESSPGVPTKQVDRVAPQSEMEFNNALRALGANGAYVGARIAYNTTTVLAPGIVQSALQPVAAVGARLFGGIVTRLVGTGAVAMFEGPIPVGKILLGGSLAWTAYKITQLQPKYHEEVETSIHESLEARRRGYAAQARQQAQAIAESFEKLNLSIRAQALAS